MGRLILVSHRLPITVDRRTGQVRRSSGGLVAALAPLHDASPDALWFGSLEGEGDVEIPYPRILPVRLPADVARRHYEGFSNDVLWPFFHYLAEAHWVDRADWEAYQKVNELFAEAVLEEARPDDVIWVHDYQLMLLPRLLRERLPDARIGFFHHIPFPSSEVFRALPTARDILESLHACNLVGLQTHGDALHMVTCFRRVLGIDFDENWTSVNGHRLRVASFPIGVDGRALETDAKDPATEQKLAEWREDVEGRKIILGIDRMDYTKGLPLRLEAFRLLLENHPEWTERAILLQIAVPSREGIARYDRLKEEVERAVGEINSRYGVGLSVPIRYIYGRVSKHELSALYRLADVGFVTPVRDGMNLVAKEYVASRVDDDGVLVLSEFAGAAAQLGEALLVNPWDVEGTARTLYTALEMPADEQKRRMEPLRARVLREDVHRWAERFVDTLVNVPLWKDPSVAAMDDPAWQRRIREEFVSAPRRLMLLDFDGTLREFVEDPLKAEPSQETLQLLEDLSSLPATEVAIVSGRDQEVLAKWLGHLPIHLAAEHGAYFRRRGSRRWEDLAGDAETAISDHLRTLFGEYVSRTPGSHMEEKRTALTWHYRAADPELALRQARELVHHLSESPVNQTCEVLQGNHVIEIRPRGIHKGRALQSIGFAKGARDFVLVAGDDRTDEDMFEAAWPGSWTIKVGDAATCALARVSSPAELRGTLRMLCDAGLDAADEPPGRHSAEDLPAAS